MCVFCGRVRFCACELRVSDDPLKKNGVECFRRSFIEGDYIFERRSQNRAFGGSVESKAEERKLSIKL